MEGQAERLSLAVRGLPVGWQRFIEKCAEFYPDIATAAKKAKIGMQAARQAMKDETVKSAIERRLSLMERESVRLAVKAQNINGGLLERELLSVIALPAKTHAMAKLKAIDRGFEYIGMTREGQFVHTAPPPTTDGEDSDKPAPPSMYRSFERTETQTHSVEVRELIHTSPIVAGSKPRPRVLPAEQQKMVPKVAPVIEAKKAAMPSSEFELVE